MLEKSFNADNAFAQLNFFRKNNLMIDLTVVVEGKEFGAHRVVMAASSESFLPHENNSNRVILNNSNVTIRGFLPLLDYCYTSMLKVSMADVNECFLAAVHLHMQPVSDFLRPYSSISSSTPTTPVPGYPDLLRLLLLQCRNQGSDPSLLLQVLQIQQNLNKLANKTGPEVESSESTSANGTDSNVDEDSKPESSQTENDDQSTDTPKNDSGVLSPASDEKEDEWQKQVQALYPGTNKSASDSNNSNNNADKLTPTSSSLTLWAQQLENKASLPLETPSALQSSLSLLPDNSEFKPDYIPPPGAIVGRTRTGKPLTQPDLPALPENGQYQSVRRRTLPTTVPKPHVCQICGSRFTRYHNLKQHIKLHSGVKPYECNICHKRFTRNYTLRLHKQKHNGGQQFKCGSCSYSGNNQNEFRLHLRMHNHHPANSAQAVTSAKDDDTRNPYALMDTPSVFSGLSGITLMQQLNMMQQQANNLTQNTPFQPPSPQSSHNLSSTRSDMDEKMDETGSNNDDDDIEEIQNEQQAMDMMKGDETAEVQVQ